MPARIIGLASIVLTLVACAGVASPTATTVPEAVSTANAVIDLESVIIEFIDGLDPNRLNEIPAWLTIPAESFDRDFRMVALPSRNGDQWPIVLATYYLYGPGVNHWIFWWRDGHWEHQRLEGFIFDDTVIDAKQEISEEGRELGLVYDHNSGGSAPYIAFSLWRWDEGAWVKIWEPWDLSGAWRGTHGSIDFPGPGLDRVVVTSSSWGLEEEKSRIFHESNPGPHRWFQDTWMREGDSFYLAESITLPSAYNTLVEFIYVLRQGDERAIRALVADPELVEQAQALGLERIPNGIMLTDISPTLEQEGPLAFIWEGQTITFALVQQNSGWLISEITVS